MLPEQLPNTDIAQEGERKAKVLFTAHGYIHESLNLQGVPVVLDTLEKHIEMHEGKKVLYLEEAGNSPEQARMLARIFSKQGFRESLLAHSLSHKLGRPPKRNEVKDLSYRIERRASNDVKKILDLGLLSIDQIQPYFLYSGLDQLRAKYNFDIVIEAHGQSVLIEDESLHRQYSELTLKAAESWNKGNFDNCMMEFKGAYSLIYQDDLVREKDMAAQLLETTDSLFQQENGGSMFVLVGEAHIPIIETIRGNLGDQAQVRYQRNMGVHGNLQLGKIDRGLRSGELASDEIYMQYFIVRLVLAQLISDSIRGGTVSTLASNYLSTLYTACTVASGISLEKGRELCEQQIPLYEFFLKQWKSLETSI